MLRINKYLARCGVASRREADNIVTAGRVTVNDKVIRTPGFMVDEVVDDVRVDGMSISPIKLYSYVLLNKPAGYLTSHSDPHHEKMVVDLLKDVPARINPVGRLDLDTEGALLLTDDGELAFRLTHPRYGVKKVYLATVRGKVSHDHLAQFQAGIKLPDGKTGKALVSIDRVEDNKTVLRMELTEGRKREVKHLCKAAGYPVVYLYREKFAGLDCRNMDKGHWRYLEKDEIRQLYDLVNLEFNS